MGDINGRKGRGIKGGGLEANYKINWKKERHKQD